jgi:hypothetical protein
MKPITAFALTTGAQAGTNIFNTRAQKQAAIRNRQFAREMFRAEQSAADRAWNMTNEYNHPVQQMQRLREAGLNPHLIYGKGAQNTAPMMAKATGKPSTEVAPMLGGADIFGRAQGLMRAKQDTDNLASQNKVLNQEALLKAAQTLETITKAKKGQFDLELANETRDEIIKRIRLENDLHQANLNYTINKDTREGINNKLSVMLAQLEKEKVMIQRNESKQRIKESQKRVSKMEQEIKNLIVAELHEHEKRAKTRMEKERIRRDIKRVRAESNIKDKVWKMFENGVHPDSHWLFKVIGTGKQNAIDYWNSNYPSW